MPETISPLENAINYMMVFSFLIDAFGFGILIWMIGQRDAETPRRR